LKGSNVQLDINEWAERWGVSRREVEVALIYLVKRGSLSGEFVGGTDVPVVNDITDMGMEDYEDKAEQKSPVTTEPTDLVSSNPDTSTVFVVHGRNEELRLDLFEFLRAIGLHPLEFSEAIALTGKAAPHIGEILVAAFRKAQAVIVLFSPDDEARLKDKFQRVEDPSYEKRLTPQPRQNVLFEAGLAFGYKPDRTIIVTVGELRPFSDIYGRHEVRLTNDAKKRRKLANRLKDAKCAVKIDGKTDWLEVGNFDVKPNDTPVKQQEEARKKLSMSEADKIALDYVKRERPQATGITITARTPKDNNWIIRGKYKVHTALTSSFVGGVLRLFRVAESAIA
jgi:predicted nucleotide-binding protein